MNTPKFPANSALPSASGRLYRLTQAILGAMIALPSLTAHADYVIRGEGKDQPFCEAILATLNKTQPANEKLPCVSELVLKMSGVSDPPWQKLDLSQHENLARDILLINTVGFTEFFAETKSTVPGFWPKPEEIARYPEYFKKEGAELFAFRSPPDPDKWIVTLRLPNDMCGTPSRRSGERPKSAWAIEDLKELARVPLHYGRGKRPLLHRGRLYFADIYGDVSIQLFLPGLAGGFSRPACSIEYIPTVPANRKGSAK